MTIIGQFKSFEQVADIVATGPGIVAASSGRTLSENDSWGVFSNEGAVGLATFQLPAASAGLTYTGIVYDANGIKFLAAGSNLINVSGIVSVAGGYVTSTTKASALMLKAVNSNEWFAISITGTWTVT